MRSSKNLLLSVFTVLAMVAASFVVHAADPVSSISAEDSLDLLLHGNEFYARGSLGNLVHESLPKTREQLAAGQHPYAIVVSCSDSRVSPEIVFNKGLGEIFVVRVAGNIVAPQSCSLEQPKLGSHELGSIEYAVEHLGTKLILVLGHEQCGAVKATVNYFKNPVDLGPNLMSLVDAIYPAVVQADFDHPQVPDGALAEFSADENIRMVLEQIEADSAIIRDAIETMGVKMAGYKYGISSGLVREVVPLH